MYHTAPAFLDILIWKVTYISGWKKEKVFISDILPYITAVLMACYKVRNLWMFLIGLAAFVTTLLLNKLNKYEAKVFFITWQPYSCA